jgi:hypothetical protein
MFFSFVIRRGLNRRYQRNLYAYRMRYLIFCLVVAALFIIIAAVLVGTLGTSDYAWVYLYKYAALEIIMALIFFCRLQNMQNQSNVIIVNQNVLMQPKRRGM